MVDLVYRGGLLWRGGWRIKTFERSSERVLMLDVIEESCRGGLLFLMWQIKLAVAGYYA